MRQKKGNPFPLLLVKEIDGKNKEHKMKSILLAALLTLLAAGAAQASDNPIPGPNQLVEQQLLPRFVSQLKLESKSWHKGFTDISERTAHNNASNKQDHAVKITQHVDHEHNPEA